MKTPNRTDQNPNPTFTELEPNKSTQNLNRTEPLSSKKNEPNTNPKFGFFPITVTNVLQLEVCSESKNRWKGPTNILQFFEIP